jgi:hypothetical protein
MYQYLNITRLRTYGGEGVLAKLLRIEARAMAVTAAQKAAWTARKPASAEIAGFQDAIAAEVLGSLKQEFPDILGPVFRQP